MEKLVVVDTSEMVAASQLSAVAVRGAGLGPAPSGRPAPGLQERDRLGALRTCALSAGLDEAELLRLARTARRRDLRRRDVLYLLGDPATEIYLVLSGALKLSRLSADGKEVTLTLVGPGELCGEDALVESGPRTASADALVESRLLGIPAPDFEQAMRTCPALALGVTRALVRRLRQAEELVEDLATREVPVRLARLLLRLAERYGAPEDGRIALTLPLAHQDLAHCIGSTRETTTVTLNGFRRRGLIEMAPRHIVIRDLEALRVWVA